MTGAAPSSLHATAVVVGEIGILICGPSGSGKSALARALVRDGASHGAFAALVGDDRLILSRAGQRLIARPHPKIAGLLEVRGQGILPQAFEPSAVIHLAVELSQAGPDSLILPRYPEKYQTEGWFGGVCLPLLKLPSGQSAADNGADVQAFVQRILTAAAK